MEIPEKNEGCFQGPISIENSGNGGYQVEVCREYSFVAYSSGDGLTFNAKNRDQTDELIQVLEGVLEAIKTTKMKDEIYSKLDPFIETKIEMILKKKANEIDNEEY